MRSPNRCCFGPVEYFSRQCALADSAYAFDRDKAMLLNRCYDFCPFVFVTYEPSG
jgi:hypothetical protein